MKQLPEKITSLIDLNDLIIQAAIESKSLDEFLTHVDALADRCIADLAHSGAVLSDKEFSSFYDASLTEAQAERLKELVYFEDTLNHSHKIEGLWRCAIRIVISTHIDEIIIDEFEEWYAGLVA